MTAFARFASPDPARRPPFACQSAECPPSLSARRPTMCLLRGGRAYSGRSRPTGICRNSRRSTHGRNPPAKRG